MSRRRKKYVPKKWESKGEVYMDDSGSRKADTSANIYESMLTSKAFAFLTDRQKMLYVCCKAQYYGKRKPGRDYPDVEHECDIIRTNQRKPSKIKGLQMI